MQTYEFVYTDIYNMTIRGVIVCVYIRVCIYVCAYSRIARCAVPFVCCEYTACRRPIGCFNLQVFFRKRATTHRSVLWKITYIYIYIPFVCCQYTGWRKPMRCFKLQFIFHKRATNYRALLRKTISTDMASYGSSPPCI